MKVATAVRRELRALRERDAASADSASAAMALVLARELDAPDHVDCPQCGARVTVEGNSGTQKAQIARALAQVMQQVRGSAPVRRGKNPVDELGAQRDKRRSGRPAP